MVYILNGIIATMEIAFKDCMVKQKSIHFLMDSDSTRPSLHKVIWLPGAYFRMSLNL